MLAKVGADLPPGAFYEPKWDGFRAIVFRDGDEVEIGSRNTRPMARYFPEVVAAALESLPPRCVVDGEIVVPGSDGRLDFFSLQQRLHPAASRVDLLAGETPASFVAFDLLAAGRRGPDGAAVLRAAVGAGGRPGGRAPAGPPHPHHARRGTRARVVRALRGRRARRHHRQGRRAGLRARQARDDEDQARADGRLRARRLPGPQVGAGRDRLAACSGCTTTGRIPCRGGTRAGCARSASSARSRWRGGASCSRSCSRWCARSRTTRGTGRASTCPASAAFGSRWNPGKSLSFVPLRPERVLEVRYDHMEGSRFRHPPQFVRWRPDREPESCGYAQLERPVDLDVAQILG